MNKDIQSLTICFYYCEKCAKRIHFSLEVKRIDRCFTCGETVEVETLENPIEKPKTKSILITLSFGELTPLNYSSEALLHTGISNSKLDIYNFWDEYKIQSASDKLWKDVININIETQLSDSEFDSALHNSFLTQKSSSPKYHQLNNNCFDFVTRFLTVINFKGINWTKEKLVSEFIQRYVLNLDRYCLVYKNVLKSNFFETNSKELKITYSICDLCECAIEYNCKYRCQVCKDYDLCSKCYKFSGHQHTMILSD
jgi:hypothetical protein